MRNSLKWSIKHHGKVLRPTQCEGDIRQPSLLQAFERISLLVGNMRHCLGQLLVSLSCDLRQQCIFVPEVPVRSVMRNAGTARHLSQRKSRWPNFGDEGNGGIEENLLQIAVMVRQRCFHPDAK